MKVRDFNFKNQSHNRQTKVVVISKNDLIKVGTVLTVGDADEFMKDAMDDLVPYKIGSTDKQNKKRWDFIDEYRKKIIKSLELKNQ
jgi:hypothetical protein